uniref:Reverse transcriptase domain-containing protein n=1 Tax=Tanacetum cinerariifolium TaxID=118510 RepID=A0A6L2K5Y6_TANCI|nr:reverse transcriptase domain-containing protein [Tanacetum cinerariifolium]
MMRQIQTVKAVDTKCETCGGPHSFTECPTVDGYTQVAAYANTGNYNSGGNSYQPQGDRNLLSYRSNNYIGPPDFNQPNVQNRYNQNQNQSYNQNQGNNKGNYQNRGSNFNQWNNQNQVFNQNQGRGNNFNQPPTYQAPTHQPQVVPQVSDFQAYMKANDAVMKNMQTQMTSLTNLNIELKNMFGQFMKMNTASSLSTGSLPRNTVPNPQEDLKVITTRSAVTLAGPSVSPPPLSKEPSPASTSISSSKMPEVTKDTVQPSIENIQPSVAQTHVPIEHVVAPKPKPTIPYPLRVNKQKLHKKDDALALKFVEIFRNLHFESLVSQTLSCICLNQSTTRPADIAEDVFVKVGKFHFPTNFVVVDYVVDPRVPLILRRPFLRTKRALIDVYGEELALRIDAEAITFKSDNPTLISDPIIALSSPSLTPFEGGDFILEEIKACLTSESIPPEINDTNLDLEGDIRLLEELLNKDPSSSPLPLKELNLEEIKIIKSSINKPPELELKELPSHLEYAFLERTEKLPIIIYKELNDEEKSPLLEVLKSHKWAIAWKISDIKGAENLAADHLFKLENPYQDELEKKEITETFSRLLEWIEQKYQETVKTEQDRTRDYKDCSKTGSKDIFCTSQQVKSFTKAKWEIQGLNLPSLKDHLSKGIKKYQVQRLNVSFVKDML